MYLEIKHLYKSFPKNNERLVVLKDINMSIERGEFICAVGASGSGKSTLVRQLAGLDTPTSGEVLIDGVPVSGPGPDRGMVFQNYTLYPWLNVLENVGFGLELQDIPEKKRRERASYYLDMVGLSRKTPLCHGGKSFRCNRRLARKTAGWGHRHGY